MVDDFLPPPDSTLLEDAKAMDDLTTVDEPLPPGPERRPRPRPDTNPARRAPGPNRRRRPAQRPRRPRG